MAIITIYQHVGVRVNWPGPGINQWKWALIVEMFFAVIMTLPILFIIQFMCHLLTFLTTHFLSVSQMSMTQCNRKHSPNGSTHSSPR